MIGCDEVKFDWLLYNKGNFIEISDGWGASFDDVGDYNWNRI